MMESRGDDFYSCWWFAWGESWHIHCIYLLLYIYIYLRVYKYIMRKTSKSVYTQQNIIISSLFHTCSCGYTSPWQWYVPTLPTCGHKSTNECLEAPACYPPGNQSWQRKRGICRWNFTMKNLYLDLFSMSRLAMFLGNPTGFIQKTNATRRGSDERKMGCICPYVLLLKQYYRWESLIVG